MSDLINMLSNIEDKDLEFKLKTIFQYIDRIKSYNNISCLKNFYISIPKILGIFFTNKKGYIYEINNNKSFMSYDLINNLFISSDLQSNFINMLINPISKVEDNYIINSKNISLTYDYILSKKSSLFNYQILLFNSSLSLSNLNNTSFNKNINNINIAINSFELYIIHLLKYIANLNEYDCEDTEDNIEKLLQNVKKETLISNISHQLIDNYNKEISAEVNLLSNMFDFILDHITSFFNNLDNNNKLKLYNSLNLDNHIVNFNYNIANYFKLFKFLTSLICFIFMSDKFLDNNKCDYYSNINKPCIPNYLIFDIISKFLQYNISNIWFLVTDADIKPNKSFITKKHSSNRLYNKKSINNINNNLSNNISNNILKTTSKSSLLSDNDSEISRSLLYLENANIIFNNNSYSYYFIRLYLFNFLKNSLNYFEKYLTNDFQFLDSLINVYFQYIFPMTSFDIDCDLTALLSCFNNNSLKKYIDNNLVYYTVLYQQFLNCIFKIYSINEDILEYLSKLLSLYSLANNSKFCKISLLNHISIETLKYYSEVNISVSKLYKYNYFIYYT